MCTVRAGLRGKNRIRKFRETADRLASRMARLEGVAGVVFLGGLTRGFADRFSDLDVTVFLSKRDRHLRRQICDIGLEEKKRSGIDLDLEVHVLEDFRKRRLSEAERWEYSRAEIAFDQHGEIKKVFDEKLRVSKDFWIRRIVVCATYLRWYCCPQKEDVGTVAEAWIERGDLVSAHYCLNYSIDLLVKLVFALNNEFLPAPKWRMFYSYSLKWLPDGYRELVEQALTMKNISRTDFNRRLRALRKVWLQIVPRIKKETGLTAEQITRYFVKKVLHL